MGAPYNSGFYSERKHEPIFAQKINKALGEAPRANSDFITLANKSGLKLNLRNLYRYRHGETIPSAQDAMKIFKLLNIKADSLKIARILEESREYIKENNFNKKDDSFNVQLKYEDLQFLTTELNMKGRATEIVKELLDEMVMKKYGKDGTKTELIRDLLIKELKKEMKKKEKDGKN